MNSHSIGKMMFNNSDAMSNADYQDHVILRNQSLENNVSSHFPFHSNIQQKQQQMRQYQPLLQEQLLWNEQQQNANKYAHIQSLHNSSCNSPITLLKGSGTINALSASVGLDGITSLPSKDLSLANSEVMGPNVIGSNQTRPMELSLQSLMAYHHQTSSPVMPEKLGSVMMPNWNAMASTTSAIGNNCGKDTSMEGGREFMAYKEKGGEVGRGPNADKGGYGNELIFQQILQQEKQLLFNNQQQKMCQMQWVKPSSEKEGHNVKRMMDNGFNADEHGLLSNIINNNSSVTNDNNINIFESLYREAVNIIDLNDLQGNGETAIDGRLISSLQPNSLITNDLGQWK